MKEENLDTKPLYFSYEIGKMGVWIYNYQLVFLGKEFQRKKNVKKLYRMRLTTN